MDPMDWIRDNCRFAQTQDRLQLIRQIAEQYRAELEQAQKYQPAYYGYPKRWGVVPEGRVKDYDPSFPTDTDREYHPLAGGCRGIATTLAHKLSQAGIQARAIGGWFQQPGSGMHYPESYMAIGPTLPSGKTISGKQHWWVEAEGYYVDISADQFFPDDPKRQIANRVMIMPKEASEESHWPHRRRPLYRNVPLPENLEQMAQAIVSSTRPNLAGLDISGEKGKNRFMQWITTWGKKKFGLSDRDVYELNATIVHEDIDTNLGSIAQVRRLLGEIVPDTADQPKGGREDLWGEMTEEQRDALTNSRPTADLALKHWNEMTPRQRSNIVAYVTLPTDFIISLWDTNQLSSAQRARLIYELPREFIEARWPQLDDKVKESAIGSSRLDEAFVERHWKELTHEQRLSFCARKDISDGFIQRHWNELGPNERFRVMHQDYKTKAYRNVPGIQFDEAAETERVNEYYRKEKERRQQAWVQQNCKFAQK